MNPSIAKARPCTACKKHFIGIADGLCPDCEKDSEFYRLSRKKGDKRQFIPYPELFQQWKARRNECRELRKAADTSADHYARAEQLEREKHALLAVLTAMYANMDPALAMVEELEQIKEALRQSELRNKSGDSVIADLRARLAGEPEPWEAAMESLKAIRSKAVIPADQWRRLVQLTHPDRHAGSLAATEVTRWLMENRP